MSGRRVDQENTLLYASTPRTKLLLPKLMATYSSGALTNYLPCSRLSQPVPARKISCQCKTMKPGGRATQQPLLAVGFGIGTGRNKPKKVSRSLFAQDSRPSTLRGRTGQAVTHCTPNGNVLGSTSEVLKNWQTTKILEKERENNIDPTEKLCPPSRKARVQDIFDQCIAKAAAAKKKSNKCHSGKGKK